jgi:dinuclear metal center YbgI/SA1388 family protein
MEGIAPSRLSETWDNSGLQVGSRDWPVRRVWTCLDALPEVVSAACQEQIDLLIVHHPLIFKPLKSVDFNSPAGHIIRMAARHQMSIFSAHTNLDSASGGVNEVLAARIGLKDLAVLGSEINPGEGLGRIGVLETAMPLKTFAGKIKQDLGLSGVKFSGPPDLSVTRAALCSGSGSSMMSDFFASDAQVYVSGDMRYHDARDAEARGRGVIDIGHFGSEHLIAAALADRLNHMFKQHHMPVTVSACDLEKDPFSFL